MVGPGSNWPPDHILRNPPPRRRVAICGGVSAKEPGDSLGEFEAIGIPSEDLVELYWQEGPSFNAGELLEDPLRRRMPEIRGIDEWIYQVAFDPVWAGDEASREEIYQDILERAHGAYQEGEEWTYVGHSLGSVHLLMLGIDGRLPGLHHLILLGSPGLAFLMARFGRDFDSWRMPDLSGKIVVVGDPRDRIATTWAHRLPRLERNKMITLEVWNDLGLVLEWMPGRLSALTQVIRAHVAYLENPQIQSLIVRAYEGDPL